MLIDQVMYYNLLSGQSTFIVKHPSTLWIVRYFERSDPSKTFSAKCNNERTLVRIEIYGNYYYLLVIV